MKSDDSSSLTRDIAPFGVRMPADLKERVANAAKANNRSMNAEIVATLEVAYPEEDVLDALLNDLASMAFFYKKANAVGRRQFALNVVEAMASVLPQYTEELREILEAADYDSPEFPFVTVREGDHLRITGRSSP